MRHAALMLVGVWLACGAPMDIKSPEPDPWTTDPIVPDNVPTTIIYEDPDPPRKPKPKPKPKQEDEEDDCDSTPDGCLIYNYEYA